MAPAQYLDYNWAYRQNKEEEKIHSVRLSSKPVLSRQPVSSWVLFKCIAPLQLCSEGSVAVHTPSYNQERTLFILNKFNYRRDLKTQTWKKKSHLLALLLTASYIVIWSKSRCLPQSYATSVYDMKAAGLTNSRSLSKCSLFQHQLMQVPDVRW